MKNGILIIILMFTSHSFAFEIEAKMLAQGSAVLVIDGKQRMLRDGMRSPEGVLLVSSDGKQAVVEVEGKKQKMNLSRQIATQFTKADKTEIRIASGYGEHYHTKGLINGTPVNFLVDTGATYVSMSHQDAEKLGIDYRAGMPISMNTANGVTGAFQITLQSVSVGNIVIHNVPAVVSTSGFTSELLLGNSYLSKVDLKIDQGVLILREK